MESVLKKLKIEVEKSGLERDILYYQFHEKRFLRVYDFLKKNVEKKKLRVLDIGSHYLHTSILAKELGYEVHSMDVSDFWELDFVKERAEKHGICPIVENDLGTVISLDNKENYYDIILFTEIMEHITFNPIDFWKKVHKAIKCGGMIYISTPNSLSLPGIVRSIKNLFSFRGIGISVPRIFECVTYGHHWKEYSAEEIKEYFNILSDDFKVSVVKYHYKKYQLEGPHFGYKLLAKIGNMSSFFAEDLEAVVSVNKLNGWKIKQPKY